MAKSPRLLTPRILCLAGLVNELSTSMDVNREVFQEGDDSIYSFTQHILRLSVVFFVFFFEKSLKKNGSGKAASILLACEPESTGAGL